MNLIEVTDITHPSLAPYRKLTSPKKTCEELIIVESPKVISRALEAGLNPVSLLCEKKHLEGDAAGIISGIGDSPVYTGTREVLERLTGYVLTRGVLCAMRRPGLRPVDFISRVGRICVIYDVCEATNVGVIFRTAAALGYDGIVVTSRTCDPFSRRAVRVSMGAVFQIPWTVDDNIITHMEENGFQTVSMALTPESVWLQDFKVESGAKYGVLLGSEGYGLPDEVIASTTHTVKIPMYHGVDSLNVGSAAAIALWHFRNPD